MAAGPLCCWGMWVPFIVDSAMSGLDWVDCKAVGDTRISLNSLQYAAMQQLMIDAERSGERA
jgi:hypothetical protein